MTLDVIGFLLAKKWLTPKQMIVRFINKCECQKRTNEQIQKIELAAWSYKGRTR